MKNFKVLDQIDLLMLQYEDLVEEASYIDRVDPRKAMKKLRKASKLQVQIEELKLARNN